MVSRPSRTARARLRPWSVVFIGVLLAGCAGQTPTGGGGTETELRAPESADLQPTRAGSATGPGTPATTPARTASGGAEGSVASGTLPVGRLLFDSDRSDNLDIWYLEAGSGEPIQMTSDPGSDRTSAWHPDGNELINVTNNPARDAFPSWGPLR